MSRLHHAMPDLGARFVWHTMWRKARRGDPLAACSDLGVSALVCLQERDRAEEEAGRLEAQPGLVGHAFRHRTGIASRALKRRGWDAISMTRVARDQGVPIYVLAARVLRAERAPEAP